MINIFEVNETNKMVEQENLDVRTITIGISLLDCIDSDLKKLNENIYKKITTVAKDLVKVGEEIERPILIRAKLILVGFLDARHLQFGRPEFADYHPADLLFRNRARQKDGFRSAELFPKRGG